MMPNIEEIRDALAKTQGNLTNAAKLLGCRRETIWHWAKANPEVATAIKESKKQLLDRCLTSAQALALGVPLMDEEGKFIGWQERPDPQMLRYFISKLGSDEGFGDSLDITTNGKDINSAIQVEIIDSRDKIEVKEEE